MLKKTRPAAKKNANYGGRTKAARTSSPARNSPALPDDDDLSDVLELKTRPVDPRVEPPLVDDGDDDYAPSSPAPPKSKPKSKAAAKSKAMLGGKSVPPEKPKAAALKPKAKTQTGARTRAAATKAKGAGDEKKTAAPQKTKAKAKKKPEVLSADEGEDKGGREEKGEVELAKNPPAVIEVFSSPPEPPKAIPPKRKPSSRVTAKEVFFQFHSLDSRFSYRGANRSFQECVTVDPPRAEKPTKTRPAPKKKAVLPQVEEDTRVEEVAMEPVEVIVDAPAPSPVRSTPAEMRTKMPTKPISEQVFEMSVERKQDDHTSNSTKVEYVAELRVTNGSGLVEPNPPAAASDVVDHEVEAEVEVEKEAVATRVQVRHIADNVICSSLTGNATKDLDHMDVEPYRFDPTVAKSPTEVYSYSNFSSLIHADDSWVQIDWITKASTMRIRELPEPSELCPLEKNPGDGQPPEAGGIRGFTPPQPIMNRMPVGISTPTERLEISAGPEVTAQSTPATLPRGRQQAGRITFGKQKVTFATSPLEKGSVRFAQNEITPRSGVQRRTIFEDDVLGANSGWGRSPAKSSEKHSALVGVRCRL